ncbi:MAG: AraC family transcriptional regulator [Gemmatimonadaceae bacterium]
MSSTRAADPTGRVPLGNLVLPYGHFFGSYQARRKVAGFELAVLKPDSTRTVERHTHEEAHFVLLLDGLYVSSATGAPSIASGPTLVYNPPGTTHRDRFEPRDGAFSGRFFTLSVSEDRLRAATEEAPLIERATNLTMAEGIGLAQRIVYECAAWEAASPLVAEGLALELLGLVSRTTHTPERTPPKWLRSAREIMLDRGADVVSVGEIAAAVGVHPVHLARVFRGFYGCTPGDFLRRHRLERGAVLLRETSHPISDVALSSGFVDQSHFSKAFKKGFGVSPGTYRRYLRCSSAAELTIGR